MAVPHYKLSLARVFTLTTRFPTYARVSQRSPVLGMTLTQTVH